MSPDFYFFILLIIAILTVMLITEIRQRYQFRKSIKEHLKHKDIYDDIERPYAFYDTYFKVFEVLTAKKQNTSRWIDDKTWSDLNMNHVFHSLNYTYTSIGENHLYHVLRLQSSLTHFSLWEEIKHDETLHHRLVTLLAKLGKQIYPKYDWSHYQYRFHSIYYLFSLLPLLSIGVMFFHVPIGIFAFLFSLLLNYVISLRFKHYVERDIDSLFFTGRVIYTVKELKKLPLSFSFKSDLSALNHVNRWRFLLLKVTTLLGYFMLMVKYTFLIDIHLYHLLIKRFKENQETIHACYRYIGELDSLLAIEQWRYHHGGCTTPTHHDNFKFSRLTHPLIEDAVPNDFVFKQNVLLTGSNASGKSTFMKAIAVNLILAQAVNTVTAQHFQYQPGIVKTTMANADDVLSGDSYFMAEIKSLKRLLAIDSQLPHYYFIDEIFKGTNTAERVAASTSALTYLAQYPQLKVFAATHDIELTYQLNSIYHNCHFNETIEKDRIHFDYTLKEGPANTRNALELIRLMKFPNEIYTDAKKRVQRFENAKKTSSDS